MHAFSGVVPMKRGKGKQKKRQEVRETEEREKWYV
jgi:hypothetical protein